MMNNDIPCTSPWPRHWVATLALATSLSFSTTVGAEEFEPTELDELEVTLEIFDETADLEAFELRLEDGPELGREIDEDHDIAERDSDREFPEMDERLERFEEEVAAARESDRRGDRAEMERSDREEQREEDVAREHDAERITDIADFDSADEMDEVDLAEERDELESDGEMSDEEMAEEEAAVEETDDLADEALEQQGDDLVG